MKLINTKKIAKWTNNHLRNFARNDAGTSSIEYALLGALIAVAIVGAVGATGEQVQKLYEYVSTQVQEALD